MLQFRLDAAPASGRATERRASVGAPSARRFQLGASLVAARHWLEALFVKACLGFLRALGPVHASNFAGAVFRAIGPKLPVNRVADRNLQLAFPNATPSDRRRIIRGAWENLGRTFGEMPHIGRLRQTPSGPGWEVHGEQNLTGQAERGGPAVFVSGHIGNWEMLPPIVAHYGMAFSSVYRAANNGRVDKLMADLRQDAIRAVCPSAEVPPLFGKGAGGARGALRHLFQGGYLGMLADQKMNDGLEAEFFGHKAMTASAPAALALRLKCPVIPGHIERTGPARLRLICDPPLPLPDTGSRERDVVKLTQDINDRMEAWIRARPEGWLWMHRRWPKPLYRALR